MSPLSCVRPQENTSSHLAVGLPAHLCPLGVYFSTPFESVVLKHGHTSSSICVTIFSVKMNMFNSELMSLGGGIAQ
jgi:hypothetical protein